MDGTQSVGEWFAAQVEMRPGLRVFDGRLECNSCQDGYDVVFWHGGKLGFEVICPEEALRALTPALLDEAARALRR